MAIALSQVNHAADLASRRLHWIRVRNKLVNPNPPAIVVETASVSGDASVTIVAETDAVNTQQDFRQACINLLNGRISNLDAALLALDVNVNA